MNKVKVFLENRSEFNNPEHIKLKNKCLRSYIWNAVILKRKQWKICFKGKYLQNFKRRMSDWKKYYKKVVIKLFRRKNNNFYALKPIHKKFSNCPNEYALEKILETVGISIINEEILSVDTIYTVKIN